MHPLVALAKLTVENYVKEEKMTALPENLPKEFLEKKAGVFVTIEKNGDLRGCIGTYLPTKDNVAQETILNAVSAATEDWRFGPVKKEELSGLSYSVYVLGTPEPIKKIKDLDPKKFGIIVKTVRTPAKAGLLLPGLEGINTTEEQIAIAREKAGINQNSERITIFRFEAKKYE